MSTIDLVKRIEALPEGKKVQIVRLVDSLSNETLPSEGVPRADEELLDRIVRQADAIYALYGPLGDSTLDVREFRDNGR